MKVWRELRFPVLVAISSTVITLGFGSIAFQVFEDSPATWPTIFARWDAAHYEAIVRAGYGATPERAFLICFFPLFPLLAAPISWLTNQPSVALLVMANVACVAAFAALYRLTLFDYGREAAVRCIVIVAIFPTSYFFHLGYAESLMLATSAGSFLAARQGRWAWAGLLALLASLTRPTGIVLVPALLVEYLQQNGFRMRAVRPSALYVLTPLIGAVFYLALNHLVFGDALRFLSLQQSIFFKQLDWPWKGLASDLTGLKGANPSSQVMTSGAHLASLVLFTSLLIWGSVRLRPCYSVYLAGLWVLTFCYSFWLSIPRLALGMFPAFILLAVALEKKPVLQFTLAFASALLYAVGLTQFVRGHWAY